ncbi:hypothetical protein NDU88_006646 [Pleurodeles waltl]|uniref:Reverse transcriptase domain-containing protein n=1 Tax=Pleurodeles waltl TaxID=8319 RepID=A0AAV7PM06_PLEWA|nr:hypothetical protein NDU88_006646 [Pleurodeles waltl]
MYDEALQEGVLPASLREALIVTILKPGKAAASCDSYRPLLMINIDNKILAKMIAARLQPLMTRLVLPDQSGFIPGRSTAHNLRTFFAVAGSVSADEVAAAVFLDATKAFDSLLWQYLFALLERVGMSRRFVNWIRLLYSQPVARLRMNGCVSEPFAVARGTWQACPLSPLLFAIAMEPLAAFLRQHHSKRGLPCRQRAILISMYADDVALYVRDPARNLDVLLDEIVRFGGVSGVAINWTKSVVLPLSSGTAECRSRYPIVWADGPVRYLCLWLSCDVEMLWLANYGKAMAWLEDRITIWRSLPLSLTGRIAVAKMIVLPKFLYLFINLPLVLTVSFLQRIRSAMIRLVWAGGQPRIAWKTLVLPFEMGGLAAPDLELYYYCAQALFAYYWIRPIRYLLHLAPESDAVWPDGLERVLGCLDRVRPRGIDTVASTVWAWSNILKCSGTNVSFAPSMHVAAAGDEMMFRDSQLWSFLQAFDLTTLDDWFVEDRLMSPGEVLGDRPATALYRFFVLRICAMLPTRFPGSPAAPASCSSLEALWSARSPKRLITKLYGCIQEQGEKTGLSARVKWARDVGENITEDAWRACCAHMKELQPNYRLRLIHFKFLHRLYYTPRSLCAMGLRADDICVRCRAPAADFLHLAWACPELYVYWKTVFCEISEMIGQEISPSPVMALLGEMSGVQTAMRHLAGMMLLLAKRRVSICWGRIRSPRASDWLRDAAYCQEQLTNYWELMLAGSRPRDIWAPLRSYLESMSV